MAETAASFIPDRQDSRNRDAGDVDFALTAPGLQADYSVPYLAHATMEGMSAAAWLQGGKLRVWAGTQLPTRIAAAAARIPGLPPQSSRGARDADGQRFWP